MTKRETETIRKVLRLPWQVGPSMTNAVDIHERSGLPLVTIVGGRYDGIPLIDVACRIVYASNACRGYSDSALISEVVESTYELADEAFDLLDDLINRNAFGSLCEQDRQRLRQLHTRLSDVLEQCAH